MPFVCAPCSDFGQPSHAQASGSSNAANGNSSSSSSSSRVLVFHLAWSAWDEDGSIDQSSNAVIKPIRDTYRSGWLITDGMHPCISSGGSGSSSSQYSASSRSARSGNCFYSSSVNSTSTSSSSNNGTTAGSSSSSTGIANNSNGAVGFSVSAPQPYGLVPALCLGDVFITANTVAGILNSSQAAAAEGRMPTARGTSARRTAQQQAAAAAAAGALPAPVPLDPAASLLLQLMQPLPPPSSLQLPHHHQQQQQVLPQPRKLFFVQKQAAEFVRQELLLQRYEQVVAARVAAGLPATAKPTSSSSSSAEKAKQADNGNKHSWNMLQGVQSAISGLTGRPVAPPGSGSSKQSSSAATAASAAATASSVHEQQQQQRVGGAGVSRAMSELHHKVAQLLPWGRQQQQQPSAVGGATTTTTSSSSSPSSAHTPGALASPDSSSSTRHQTAGVPDTPSSSSSGPGAAAGARAGPSPMVGSKRGLPAVLAAQLSSFMADLQQLEEEAVLQEGEAIMQQRQQQQQHRGGWKRNSSSSSSGPDRSRKGSSSSNGGVSISEPHQQQQQPFNFASYVARFPLAAALQLLQQHYHQHVPHALPALQQQQQQGVPDYRLGVSGGDVRACLALRGRDTFVDLEDMDSSSSNWQVGVYEPDSTEEEEHQAADVLTDGDSSSSGCSIEAVAGSQSGDEQQAGAAVAMGPHPAAAGSSSSSRKEGRWRWGKGGSSTSTAAAQDSSHHDSSHNAQQTATLTTSSSSSSKKHTRSAEASEQPAAEDFGDAAYMPLALSSSSSTSSSGSTKEASSRSKRGNSSSSSTSGAPAASAAAAPQPSVPLNQLLREQHDSNAYGDVAVALSSADVGTCDRTPVFQVPGLHFLLDTTYGEVAFSPTFMSLAHLVSFLDAAKTAATKMWIKERREGRARWRQGVETAALALAAAAAHNPGSLLTGGSGIGSGFGSSSGGRSSAAAAAAAAAAQEESEEDEDGMGDPPEAKALLEELGETPGVQSRGSAARNSSSFGGGGFGGFTVPSSKGLVGALNAVALGTISVAAAGCCGAQELLDRAALAVPAVGEWVIGLPGSVNVRAAFLEDLAAAAAEHNRGRLQPPYTVIAPAGSAANSSSTVGTSTSTSTTAAAAAELAAGAAELYDPLGLVEADPPAVKQQQLQPPLPPLELPCLDGLRLMLTAGWSLAADVLLRDGALAGAVLGGPGGLARRLQGASIQVSDEGEVALRLGLTVMAAAVTHASHLPQPYGSGSSSSKPGQGQQQQQPQQHVFELGVHLNLSQLIGVPSLQHADQLHADRAGLGRAARGVLLIGDLGLEHEELAEMPWRAPSLGLGVLPVAPLALQLQQEVQTQQKNGRGASAGEGGAARGGSSRCTGRK